MQQKSACADKGSIGHATARHTARGERGGVPHPDAPVVGAQAAQHHLGLAARDARVPHPLGQGPVAGHDVDLLALLEAKRVPAVRGGQFDHDEDEGE